MITATLPPQPTDPTLKLPTVADSNTVEPIEDPPWFSVALRWVADMMGAHPSLQRPAWIGPPLIDNGADVHLSYASPADVHLWAAALGVEPVEAKGALRVWTQSTDTGLVFLVEATISQPSAPLREDEHPYEGSEEREGSSPREFAPFSAPFEETPPQTTILEEGETHDSHNL